MLVISILATDTPVTMQTTTPLECGYPYSYVSSGSFSSPNYPLEYPNDVSCTWSIEVDYQYVIEFRVLEDFVIEDDTSCSYDSLKVIFYQTSDCQRILSMVISSLIMSKFHMFYSFIS